MCVAAKKEERRLAELKKKSSTWGMIDHHLHLIVLLNTILRSLEVMGINTNHLVSNNLWGVIYVTGPIIWLVIVTPVRLKAKAKGLLLKKIRWRSYTYSGTECRCVEVYIEGIPVIGLIDTGLDITIVCGDLLYHIISTAGLEASNIRSTDQRACTFDQKQITLDG